MAHPTSGRKSTSPIHSGRGSPVPRRWRNQLGGDENTIKDKAFKRYASNVERSLSLFDTTLQDWPDYISFLGRLLKSLQSHPTNVLVVPSKVMVAKCLAQCLNPTLPSGVHQKALELYGYVFTMISGDALARDLPLYLPGLSTTLSFASLSAQSPFLELFERHILKLDGAALRPALKAIILALLPGLEEETSEEFERALKILDGFKHAVRPPHEECLEDDHSSGDEYFWQCFFLASITSNARRLGALAYLIRRLPKLGPTSQDLITKGFANNGQKSNSQNLADIVTSPEPGLLLRCIAAGLGDEQSLIQRGFLDLLATHLPLHSSVLQKRVKTEDLQFLLAAASGVVARRDMSLNRRLWAWLLGPEVTGQDDIESLALPNSVNGDGHLASRTRYFEQFGSQVLTQTLLNLIAQDATSPVERVRPFRICLAMMDRWEIGGLVVPDIFLPIISSVRKYKIRSSKADFAEVLRSASDFFDGVESGLIWGEIMSLARQAMGSEKLTITERIDNLSLVNFIIGHFNVREEEMLLVHAPLTVLAMLVMLEDYRDNNKAHGLNSNPMDEVYKLAFSTVTELIHLIPESAFSRMSLTNQRTQTKDSSIESQLSDHEALSTIKSFYVQHQGNFDASSPPVPPRDLADLILRKGMSITCQSLYDPVSSADAGIKSSLLVLMLSKMQHMKSLDTTQLLLSMHSRLTSSTILPFSSFSSVISLATSLYRSDQISLDGLSGLVNPLVRLAWSYLSFSHPKYHVETVRCLWQLQSALSLSNHEIEASLCSLIIENNNSGTLASQNADSGQRFSILWAHTLQENAGHIDRMTSKLSVNEASGIGSHEVMLARPLFLLLDSLRDEHTQLCMTMRSWLQSLAGIEKLFHLFVTKFSYFNFLHTDSDPEKVSPVRHYTDHDDLAQCMYYLLSFSGVLRWSPDHVWAVLMEKGITTDLDISLQKITGKDGQVTLLQFFLYVCLRAITASHSSTSCETQASINQLHRVALATLHQILICPYSPILPELRLEHVLIDRLSQSLAGSDPYIQVLLLDVVFAALKLKTLPSRLPPLSKVTEQKRSITQGPISSRSSTVIDRGELLSPSTSILPASLIKCLQAGFTVASSRSVLDSWVSFLTECLPLYAETIFQILIPLSVTLCTQIGQTFSDLQTTFQNEEFVTNSDTAPEPALISLLNGLEHLLAKGHERLLQEEVRTAVIKNPDQPQGFFGNMVSGVFNSETPQSRSITANNRLSVLLSFRDAVRICYTIWSWNGHDGHTQDPASVASFNYTSLRMRNRARRLLEQLFAAEALECLETLVESWQNSSERPGGPRSQVIFHLLHVLDGSRPRHTIPAIFNAIYSRTNPGALEPSRKSTVTSAINDMDLVIFLVEYAKSLEDDAMDEIWSDCMTFLKEILANPFPHRQTLPSLLEFAAILGEKVDNTNFGEQRRMRRELSDTFLRLLTAIFTTTPVGFTESSFEGDERSGTSTDNIVTILASVTSNITKVLMEPDRILSAANTISISVIGPTFKSKNFPENVSKSTLLLLHQLARLPGTQKTWKKDLGDAFNDGKFFANSLSLVEKDWLPLLRQWVQSDKEKMPELLSRLTGPSTAGIVFGVGATSARLEADRKTQLNLRRIATLVLAAIDDNFVTDLSSIQERIVDLLSATTASSPSAATRADVYMLLRALVLKTSAIHLAVLWPIINSELHAAISSVISPDHSTASATYNNHSILQACKLLDTLLCIAPDDFQLHEWLFITDTIDAVYRPPQFRPVALVDELSEELGAISVGSTHLTEPMPLIVKTNHRRSLLGPGGIDDEGIWERKDELVAKVLRPFFSQLSIFAFESTYSMNPPDWDACKTGLLRDLFDERSIVKAM